VVEIRKKKETRGRKSKLTPELIAHLCAHISNGALCNQRANAREFPRKMPRLRQRKKKDAQIESSWKSNYNASKLRDHQSGLNMPNTHCCRTTPASLHVFLQRRVVRLAMITF
jgi:hypothetical protein